MDNNWCVNCAESIVMKFLYRFYPLEGAVWQYNGEKVSLLVMFTSLKRKSCTFFGCYPWHDTDLRLMQMSYLLLTVLTHLLKGLITLDNSHLTLLSSVLTVLCPTAAAACVFSLHTGRRGSQFAQCRVVLSGCGSSQGSGKEWVSTVEAEGSVGAPLVCECLSV